jgi:murein DD-endopeptidase MepM/ murein hydrolase activator NlpD
VGNTGLSSGAHLHLETRTGSGVTNPKPYIKHEPVSRPPAWISQSYGNPDPIYYSGWHPGIDYAAPKGTPIYAIDDGYMYRGCSDDLLGTSSNAYGYVAIVEHSSGVISIYAHMSGGPSACNYNTYW